MASKGYDKKQEDELFKAKFIAYHALIAPNINPKALPKSFGAFLKRFEGPKKVKKASHDIRQQLLEEYKEYQRNKK